MATDRSDTKRKYRVRWISHPGFRGTDSAFLGFDALVYAMLYALCAMGTADKAVSLMG
jgi:hypothetical protein